MARIVFHDAKTNDSTVVNLDATDTVTIINNELFILKGTKQIKYILKQG